MRCQIEFVRHDEDQAETSVLDTVRLIGDGDLAVVITRAEELYLRLDILPRADGFRVREDDGEIVYERHEFNETENA